MGKRGPCDECFAKRERWRLSKHFWEERRTCRCVLDGPDNVPGNGICYAFLEVNRDPSLLSSYSCTPSAECRLGVCARICARNVAAGTLDFCLSTRFLNEGSCWVQLKRLLLIRWYPSCSACIDSCSCMSELWEPTRLRPGCMARCRARVESFRWGCCPRGCTEARSDFCTLAGLQASESGAQAPRDLFYPDPCWCEPVLLWFLPRDADALELFALFALSSIFNLLLIRYYCSCA